LSRITKRIEVIEPIRPKDFGFMLNAKSGGMNLEIYGKHHESTKGETDENIYKRIDSSSDLYDRTSNSGTGRTVRRAIL
jgi:hypothetical protein